MIRLIIKTASRMVRRIRFAFLVGVTMTMGVTVVAGTAGAEQHDFGTR